MAIDAADKTALAQVLQTILVKSVRRVLDEDEMLFKNQALKAFSTEMLFHQKMLEKGLEDVETFNLGGESPPTDT